MHAGHDAADEDADNITKPQMELHPYLFTVNCYLSTDNSNV
jgi:hypothetical protein